MKYQQCIKCLMDTTDFEIIFDNYGICNHCHEFNEKARLQWFPNDERNTRLKNMISTIMAAGKGREYDCILGLSGGVDSSYLALKLKEWGLRPLVMHVDAGWNSELAVANIEALVKHCGYDLHTHVVDWEDMRDLHLAYLKAAVSNQDVPQDHIFFASLYHFAAANGIKYILSGGNLATEGIFPNSWHGSAMDSINLKFIHKKFGQRKLSSYKTISFWETYFWYPFVKKLRTVRPLNLMKYNKEKAMKELQNTVGYKPYPRKHGESLFTKFFQNYYLPTKFGFDKRLPHLSSLIVSGQISREEGLVNLKQPLYNSVELEADIAYLCKKLNISRANFDELMEAPIHHYSDFPNWHSRYRLIKHVQVEVERLLGIKLNVYS